MRYSLKGRFLIPLTVLFFLSCAVPQGGEKPQICSPVPVGIKVSEQLTPSVKVEKVVVTENGDNYLIQFTVKNETPYLLNFLYRVSVYSKNGMVSDYPTERWVVVSIDPNGEKVFETVIPKKVAEDISRVELKIKSFTPLGG
jgi:uncharacterized protein YcfL